MLPVLPPPNCVSPPPERGPAEPAERDHGDGPEVGGRGGRGRHCLPRCGLPRHCVLQRRRPKPGGNTVSKKVKYQIFVSLLKM